MNNSATTFFLILIAALFALQSPVYAKMYRWLDKNGRVFYSDKVPPKQSKLERKELNAKGRVVNTIKAAKTKEQISLEKRLAILRKEQEKIIAKQKSNDKVLLSTFRNVDDLRFTLNSKLLSVDAQKRVHEKTLDHLRENLSRTRFKAAQAERSGKKVSSEVLSDITQIEKNIEMTYQNIAQVLETRKGIETKFDKEIERFIFLTKRKKSMVNQARNELVENNTADTLGLFNCVNERNCRLAWEEARQFVLLNSTTGINISSENLVMGNDPMKETDISISVSKSKRDNKIFSIFLDLRCHKSNIGAELCQSQKADLIRRCSARSSCEN